MDVDYSGGCERHLECEYGLALFYCHEVSMLNDVRENQYLEKYETGYVS